MRLLSKPSIKVFLALPFLMAAACGPAPFSLKAFKSPKGGGLKRASFELECPESQLQAISLDGDQGTVGVTGCGKRAVYTYVHPTGWVNNTWADSANKEQK